MQFTEHVCKHQQTCAPERQPHHVVPLVEALDDLTAWHDALVVLVAKSEAQPVFTKVPVKQDVLQVVTSMSTAPRHATVCPKGLDDGEEISTVSLQHGVMQHIGSASFRTNMCR